MQLLIATQNPGKKSEFKDLLKSDSIQLLFLDDIELKDFTFPDEIGSTFKENALIKAKSLSAFSGIPTVADDSGLCVDCLDGFPGVLSARWIEGSDLERGNGLLQKMAQQANRKAHFFCSICFCQSNQDPVYFDGFQNGHIATEPKGTDGFGYDPIFIPDGKIETYAELGNHYKNQHSHRAQALNKLSMFLKEIMVN